MKGKVIYSLCSVKRKQALLVKDTRVDERFGSAESVIMMEIHSAMCAPLYRDGRVPGFIYVDRQSTTEPFDTPHLHALSALEHGRASQTAGLSAGDAVVSRGHADLIDGSRIVARNPDGSLAVSAGPAAEADVRGEL